MALDFGQLGLTKADHLDKRFEALKDERRPLMGLWRATAKLVAQRRGKFDDESTILKEYTHQHVYNESGLLARRILSAGLMNGMTSPSRPWFELDLEDQDLAGFHPHKAWLRMLRDRMLTILRVSNAYNALYSVYNELGPFGTAAGVIDPDFENIIHMHIMTAGRYVLATDDRNNVNLLKREMRLTVDEIYRMFFKLLGGAAKFPRPVRDAYDRGNYEVPFFLRHALQPNDQYDQRKIFSPQRFPIASVYWFRERDKNQGDDGLLWATGYEQKSMFGVRWDTVDNETYGVNFPAEDALGVMRQSQHMEKAYGVALEMSFRPPTLMPIALRKSGASNAPGSIIWTDGDSAQSARSLYERMNFPFQVMTEERREIEERTYRCFYADVITAISAARRQSNREMTATEVAEIVGEKLLMLGPVLERMQVELIEPLIDRIFAVMQRANLVPPAPEGMQGKRIKINHISTLAQAQRAVATQSIDRSLGATQAMAEMERLGSQVLDVINQDEVLRKYWLHQGVDPGLLNDREKLDQIRRQRQEEIAAQQQLAAAESASKTVSNMAVPTQQDQSNLVADLAGL